MLRPIARLHQCLCLVLVMCILTLTTAQSAFCIESQEIVTQENNLTFVEKQPISEEELILLGNYGDVDQITAGHRPGPRHAPHPGRVTSDIFFWAGFSLIMLSVIIYPY